MRKLRWSPVLLVLVAVGALLPWQPAAAGAGRGVVLVTTLTGAREIGPTGQPGAGDANGVGGARVVVRNDEVCATLHVAQVQLPALFAHIHEAAAGVNGDIVVHLPTPGADGNATGCTDADPALLGRIVARPAGFYVNVHTGEFPAGAVRGQLLRANDDRDLLATSLSGAEEIDATTGLPNAGDADGVGAATVSSFRGELCFSVATTGLTLPVLFAHIHHGPAGVNGPIVVVLSEGDADGAFKGCLDDVDPALRGDIALHPAQYYVNVHTGDFPAGAVRGQLSRFLRAT